MRTNTSAITKVLSFLVLASVAAAATVWAANPISRGYPSAVKLSGIITDTDCGASHGTKTHGDARCTRMCVRMGAQYALAAGAHLYVLQGHEPQLDEYAGEAVRVQGFVIRGNTIDVESVVPSIIEATTRGGE